MKADIERSAETGVLFDAEIDRLIARAPTTSAQALAAALRVMLDRHNLYDRRFTAALHTTAALHEPHRSEACARLEQVAGPPKPTWLVYLANLRFLRRLNIEVSYLYPADRRAIADRVKANPRMPLAGAQIPVQLVAE